MRKTSRTSAARWAVPSRSTTVCQLKPCRAGRPGSLLALCSCCDALDKTKFPLHAEPTELTDKVLDCEITTGNTWWGARYVLMDEVRTVSEMDRCEVCPPAPRQPLMSFHICKMRTKRVS